MQSLIFQINRNVCANIVVLFFCASSASASVEIIKLQDTTVLTGTALHDLSDVGRSGHSDRFCVINSTGRGVRLTFQASSVNNVGDPLMKDSISGKTLVYQQGVSLRDGTMFKHIRFNKVDDFFDVPAAAIATSRASCPLDGNVAKWIAIRLAPKEGLWIDQVVIKATPL